MSRGGSLPRYGDRKPGAWSPGFLFVPAPSRRTAARFLAAARRPVLRFAGEAPTRKDVPVFLKSLEIFGFKSFADRTLIEFSDGISALLGPNGCGKSNVVDAIKWVVGEQSAKSLRAESMEDIIFNGTETRKALSVAEVTVTISNETARLPLDVSEVAIKRRLYRSGESEYLINGKQAKLKEIRELFWDTGIGKSAYSVMEQGKIDQILSSKPEDRRYLFEEAAGITKHKARSREAELKLERTEENMRQVAGILGEVKRTHDTLKVQADKTGLYRELKDRIFRTELDLHLLKLRQFLGEKDRREAELAAKKRERDAVKEESDALGRSMSEGLDLVNGMETEMVDLQKTLYGLAVEKNGKEKQRSLLSDRVREAADKIDQARMRMRAVNDKIGELRDEETEKADELGSLKSRLREAEKNIAEFEAGIHAAGTSVKSNEQAIGRALAEIAAHEADIARSRESLDRITEDIVEQLDARLKESGYSAQDREQAESEILGLIGTIKARLDGKAALFRDLAEMQRTQGRDQTQAATRALADLDETASHASRLSALFERYRQATPSFIDEFLSPEGIITRKRGIDRAIARDLEAIERGRAAIGDLEGENRGLATRIEEYRKTLEEARGGRIRVQTQMAAAEEALAVFRRELAGQEAHLRELESAVYADERRLDEMSSELDALVLELDEIEARGTSLTVSLEKLEKAIQARNADLSRRRADASRLADRLARVQGELENLHLSLAQTDTELRNVRENFSEQYSRELSEFEDRMAELRTPLSELRELLAAHRNKLRDLGQVNLMAPEEYAEVKERYDFLSGQMADLEKAREDLKRITEEIRNESAELFIETYNRIKKNFHNMFRRLFGGGRAELRLADPDHVLESGIEILAQPPGKKLEAISLLSGGEKTLTAIALLFATYMVKPSPFCFLDEIDAALDEANVIRFVNLLREFGRTSQFVIITHNKKTVTGADTLLGVTMEESGVTKAIAIRLERHSPGEASIALRDETIFDDEDVEYEEGRQLAPDPAALAAAAAAKTAAVAATVAAAGTGAS